MASLRQEKAGPGAIGPEALITRQQTFQKKEIAYSQAP
jgi:hypothetical protein